MAEKEGRHQTSGTKEDERKHWIGVEEAEEGEHVMHDGIVHAMEHEGALLEGYSGE